MTVTKAVTVIPMKKKTMKEVNLRRQEVPADHLAQVPSVQPHKDLLPERVNRKDAPERSRYNQTTKKSVHVPHKDVPRMQHSIRTCPLWGSFWTISEIQERIFLTTHGLHILPECCVIGNPS